MMRRAVGLAAAAAFLVGVDTTAVNVALPAIGRDLAASLGELQGTVTAFALLSAALLTASGVLADRLGRRRVFVAGAVLFVAASGLCAIAPSAAVLVAARGAQGAASAAVTASGLAVLATATAGAERARALGTFAAVAALSFVVGPLLGGVLTDLSSWRLVFLVNVPVGVAVAVLGRRWLVESRRPVTGRFDLAGVASFTVALGSLAFALIEGPAAGWASLPVTAAAVLAAAGLVAFVRIERRARPPMIDLAVLRNATFTGAASASAVVGAGFFGMLTYLSLFLQGVLGYSAAVAGLAFLPVIVPFMAAAQIAGRLLDRVLPRSLAVVGMSMFTAGMILLALVDADATLVSFVPGLFLAGAGGGLLGPPLNAAALDRLPPDQLGAGSGILSTFRPVGVLVGTTVLGVALDAGIRWTLPAGLAHVASAVRVGDITAAARTAGWHTAVEAFAGGFRAVALVAAALGVLAAVLTAATVRETRDQPAVGRGA
jgi:EmrB/QacA subfamily drug resistance transporter